MLAMANRKIGEVRQLGKSVQKLARAVETHLKEGLSLYRGKLFFETVLVDPERPYLRLESRSWHTQHGGRAGGSV